jgi:quercetin dioxygenase-like cupin family protein
MSIREGMRAFKIEAADAPSFQLIGTLWRVLATGNETGGIVGALDERSANGAKVPMHVHDDADEIFYVLDGELTFFVGEQRIEAAPGAFVYLPRFVHHGFQVNSNEARIFNFLTPAGFERMIVDMGKPAHFDDALLPDDPNANHGQMLPEKIAKKYGMRIFPPGSK